MSDIRTPEEEFLVAIGGEIGAWRKRRDLSRDELAKAAGISSSTLGRVERGEGTDLASAWRLAQALNVPLTDLVRRAEDSLNLDFSDMQRQEIEELLRRLNDLEHGSISAEVFNRISRWRNPVGGHRRDTMRADLERALSEATDRSSDALAADKGDDAAGEPEKYHET